MPGRALLAALVFFVVINATLSPAAEGVSLASIGYTMLRWLDRAEITHHNLSVEVDPLALSARFADEVTFISRGSRHLHILLSADAVLERVTDASGEERSFLRVLGWGGMPFVLYRVEAPETGNGEPFVLRFEWRISPDSVKHVNPFVALHFFYLGHAALWHPHSPTEEFFTAEIAVTVPQGYTALADGELVSVEEAPGARERFHFRTAAPVGALGVGVGRFHPLDPVTAGDFAVQGFVPRGWSASVEQVTQYTAAALEFFAGRLGPLPMQRFFVAELPFAGAASYASLHGLVYGGELDLFGLTGEEGLAFLAAHEAAHKWVGGVAGTRILGSAWLSEGLAEYLGYLALEELLGREKALELFRKRTYEPFVSRMGEKHRALSAIELFDDDSAVLYEKGALVFRMLHRRLGDDAFFGLVRHFLDTYRQDFASGTDFIRLSAEYVQGLRPGALAYRESGDTAAEIRSFFDQWVKGTATLDYALEEVAVGPKSFSARVVSRGKLTEPGPVTLRVHLESGEVWTAQAWLGERIDLELPGRPVAAYLDPEMWLADANPANNRWEETRL